MSSSPSKGRILIVDDDSGLLKVLEEVVLQEGFEPSLAPDGTTALRQLESGDFDLLLDFLPTSRREASQKTDPC